MKSKNRQDCYGVKRNQFRKYVRYCYKSPLHRRATFSIYEDTIAVDGKRSFRVIKDERLYAINQSYKIKAQTLDACRIQVKEIIRDLYKKDPRCRKHQFIHNSENQKVLDDYWEQEYSHRQLENPMSTRHELNRAIDTLGILSIYSASRQEIQTAIDTKVSGDVQRRMIARMNQILKFVGRTDVKLRKHKPEYKKVTYLNEEEFKKVVAQIQDKPLKALSEVCFYSGLRIGEAYALTKGSIDRSKSTLRVDCQVDRSGRLKPSTKTGRTRRAYLFPEGLRAFDEWVNIPSEEKARIKRVCISMILKKYCKKVFPHIVDKHITFHGLRHSYAMNLFRIGTPMGTVAQSLGNSLSVCQKYYVGFEINDESIITIQTLVARAKAQGTST